MRILSKKAILWTEMIVDETVFYNKNALKPHLELDDDSTENVVCQIGGCTPMFAAEAVRVIHQHGCDKVNLNMAVQVIE